MNLRTKYAIAIAAMSAFSAPAMAASASAGGMTAAPPDETGSSVIVEAPTTVIKKNDNSSMNNLLIQSSPGILFGLSLTLALCAAGMLPLPQKKLSPVKSTAHKP